MKKIIYLACTIIVFYFGINFLVFSAEDNESSDAISIISNDSSTAADAVIELSNDSMPAQVPELSPEERDRLLSDYYSRAFEAFRNGEYPYAALMFEKYLTLKTDNIKIYHYLSQIYLHLKQYSDAAVVLKRATELEPSSFSHWHQLGTAYMGAGFTNEAIHSFEKALEIRPDTETLFQLGLCYERINELQKARELYEYVVAIKPNHADAHFSIGLLDFRTQDFSSATERIDRALKLNPEHPLYLEYRDKVNAAINSSLKDNDTMPHENE
ncbi:tetratricopeptide repeat protein [bacterium]|nr:tetratricopeptide repeat protein [bacterium]MCP5462544.1 tetratricopeptide repeat protein [bacterium]